MDMVGLCIVARGASIEEKVFVEGGILRISKQNGALGLGKMLKELSRSWKKHPKSLPIVAMRRVLYGGERSLSLSLSLSLFLCGVMIVCMNLQMGLMYGCSVEDVITGLVIQCKGWEPVYYSPYKRAFLGVAATTLDDALIQYKRWAEGMFQIFFSKYCPFFYGHRKIKLGAQMGYCVYLLWAPNSLPMLYYTIVPPLFLLRGVALFPEVPHSFFLYQLLSYLTSHMGQG